MPLEAGGLVLRFHLPLRVSAVGGAAEAQCHVRDPDGSSPSRRSARPLGSVGACRNSSEAIVHVSPGTLARATNRYCAQLAPVAPVQSACALAPRDPPQRWH